jgi:hypothetical protein
MPTIIPQSESLKRAVKWLSDHFKNGENQNRVKLLNEAILKYDLSPKDADFLFHIYTKK